MKFFNLLLFALKTTLSQKIILTLLIAMSVILLIFITAVHIDTDGGTVSSVSIYGSKPFTEKEFPMILPSIAETYSTLVYLSLIILSIITTAHIIPDAINSRTITLFLTKPISRASIIISIFLGVSAAISLIQILFIIGLWLILTLKTGIFFWNLLISFIPLVLSFCTLYAFMVYIGIVGKSAGIVTAVAMGHVIFISPLLTRQDSAFISWFGDLGSQIIKNIFRITLPGVYEMQDIFKRVVMSDQFNALILPILMLPCLLYIYLSTRSFNRMDF